MTYSIETLTDAQRDRALDRSINALREDDPLRSAAIPVMGWQKVVLTVLLVSVVCLAIWRPMQTAVALIGLCTLGYVLTMTDRVMIFRRGLESRPITITDEQARAIPDDQLPRYTILVPAYNEPEVVDDLIGAMANLEYPRDKLQVLLLLEADDAVTIEAANRCANSDAISILLVPPAEPRTNPKACNYGMHFAAGDIVMIYDAEDLPESLSFAGWSRPSRRCPTMLPGAGELGNHNGHQNLLTGWFTAEYGLWFGYLLPGMMLTALRFHWAARRITSGHRCWMRSDVGSPDVTEDADLGLRIAASGYRTAVIDSQTLEEANSDPINWIRQRSRWYKGYLQTWLVHIRRPVTLLRTIGLHSFIRFNLVLAGTPIIAVLNLVFWLITVLWFLGQPAAIGAVFPWYIYFPALVALVLGNFATLYMNVIALREDDRPDLLVCPHCSAVLGDDERSCRERHLSADPQSVLLGEDVPRSDPTPR